MALDLLNTGQINQALLILTTLYHKDPTDVDRRPILCNLRTIFIFGVTKDLRSGSQYQSLCAIVGTGGVCFIPAVIYRSLKRRGCAVHSNEPRGG